MAGDTGEEGGAGKPSVKAFSCASCGAPISVRAMGHTVAVVCPSCRAVVDALDENHRIINEAQGKIKFHPVIPLGKRGTLRGEKWEAIGFMVRTDGSGVYSWREYLLFNPYKGFRWLTEYNGHWNYIITTRKNPVSLGATATYMNNTYRLYNRGEARTIFVLGEFYWCVKVGETVKVEDYIAPPEMLTKEYTKEEEIWSVAEYIEADAISSAFKLEHPLPAKIGVAPNQPNQMTGTMGQIWKHTAIFLGIILLIQLMTLFFSTGKFVYSGGFTIMTSGTTEKLVSEPFEVGGRDTNLEFALEAPVDNSWLDLDIELVNEGTSAIREFSHGVEYYHGRDSDGPWTEGSQTKSALLMDVPAGRYHMNIDATLPAPTVKELISNMKLNFGPGQAAQNPPPAPSQPLARFFQLTVRRGVVTWSGFALSVIAILAYPIVMFTRKESFEVKRWEESDYSPYQSND